MSRCLRLFLACLTVTPFLIGVNQLFAQSLSLKQQPGKVQIRYGDSVVGTYVFRDAKTRRPYFCNLREPGGRQLTRNHPPKPSDSADHATMHPGVWMAFGDISGEDFWRNKATVRHRRFLSQPSVKNGRASFEVENDFVATDGKPVCRQTVRYQWLVLENGFMLLNDVTFRPIDGKAFYFGDQEEMGLGVRVATELCEDRGKGRIRSSGRQTGAKNTWGQKFMWCDYAGHVDGRHVGVAILAHPNNPRGSWWHNRGYGLMVANMFGRKAMRQGKTSKIDVADKAGFRFRYAVFLHGGDKPASIKSAFGRFVEETKETR